MKVLFGALLTTLGLSSAVVALPITVNDSLLNNSRLVYQFQPKIEEYRLVLSSVKKINGQWRAERDRRLTSQLSRQTFELDRFWSFAEAKKSLREQLAGNTVLFTCDGLDCGSSNAWANEVLNVKQLYGLDSEQLYAVAQTSDAYIVLYLVKRGNGRIYLQQDMLAIPSGSVEAPQTPDDINNSFLNQGYWVITDAQVNAEEPTDVNLDELLRPLLTLLQRQPELKLRVVGHSDNRGVFSLQQARSMRSANVVYKYLLRAGISHNRLTVHGIGAIAPRQPYQSRVEIVPW